MSVLKHPDASAERRDWTIEKVVPGGDGMARLEDGRVGFATGAFTGDVIRPISVEGKKGHVRARRWTLVTPSLDRVEPACPVAESCGGCDWMALSRTAQLEHKKELLHAALTRTGGFSDLPNALTVNAPGTETGYRSRVRYHVDARGLVGFFSRGSQSLVEIPRCLVCRPELGDALAVLRRVNANLLAAFSDVEVRVADSGPRIAAWFTARSRDGADTLLPELVRALPADWTVAIDGAGTHSDAVQRYPLPENAVLEATAGVFTQVNWDVNVELVAAVVRGARARGVKRFVDAYAGAGNFTLPLLAAGMTGVSVERDARAVECARRAAAAQGFADGFVAATAERHLDVLFRRGERFDLVLLDPPRAGAREALDAVVKLAAPWVVYCSCDPVTLARNLSTLARSGYRLEDVQGFDMFPSTHHLETMAWMTGSQ